MTHEEKNTQSASLLTEAESLAFIAAGYDIDEHGRPLHPYLHELDPNIPSGKGGFWFYGPNATADPIVITDEEHPHVLLVTRKDHTLAFPGGFVDPGEANPIMAAYRELAEETGLETNVQGIPVYEGIVSDPRTSANAWAETSAYLFRLPKAEEVRVVDENETNDVGWYDITTLDRDRLYGSHADLLEKALENRNRQKRTLEEILNIPAKERHIQPIDAGHMAYRHYYTRHNSDHLFVKEHDASRFSDPFREAHSRTYLKKEFSLFNHIKQSGCTFVPERVALIDDSLLAMDALHPDNGWLWRAPREASDFERYVQDTIRAFDRLQVIEPPEHPEYHASIKDTYSTLWEEGWDTIDDVSMEKIIDKIRQFSTHWSPEQYDASEGLIHSLPIIRQKAVRLNRDVPLFLAHNDARQSNIAWHPHKGTKLVDWSWGDRAPKNADTTMFLIDLVKSGRDVTPYLKKFNPDQAHIVIGWDLAHSLWQTRDGSQTVREHQVASAVAAYRLLTDVQ